MEKKELDVNLTANDISDQLGVLMFQILSQTKQIKVLEARVDELETPEESDA